MTKTAEDYRQRVRDAHPAEFALHGEVMQLFEEALTRERAREGVERLAIDMLMHQGFKTHVSVRIVCEHGFMEDAATLTRRLFELTLQALYIRHPGTEDERRKRAGRYLAFLWRQVHPHWRAQLPQPVREEWETIAVPYDSLLPAKARDWSDKDRRKMCHEVKGGGAEGDDLYDDYRFLSALAHGSSEKLLVDFSRTHLHTHEVKYAGVLMVYASRYQMSIGQEWQKLFGAADSERIGEVGRQLNDWQRPSAAPPSELTAPM